MTLLKVKLSVGVWETDGRRDTNTVILIHNFFSWPYHAVLSSRLHYVLLLLSRRGVLNQKTALSRSAGRPVTHWGSRGRKLRLTQDSHGQTVRILRGHVIYHFVTPTPFRSTTWLLPLIFTSASCAENLWLTALSKININIGTFILQGFG